jgi:hypothetical protein
MCGTHAIDSGVFSLFQVHPCCYGWLVYLFFCAVAGHLGTIQSGAVEGKERADALLLCLYLSVELLGIRHAHGKLL